MSTVVYGCMFLLTVSEVHYVVKPLCLLVRPMSSPFRNTSFTVYLWNLISIRKVHPQTQCPISHYGSYLHSQVLCLLWPFSLLWRPPRPIIAKHLVEVIAQIRGPDVGSPPLWKRVLSIDAPSSHYFFHPNLPISLPCSYKSSKTLWRPLEITPEVDLTTDSFTCPPQCIFSIMFPSKKFQTIG